MDCSASQDYSRRSQWILYKSTCSSIISSLPHQLISWSDLYSPCCHRWRWCKLNSIFCASVLFSFLKWSWFVFRLMHFVFTFWLTHNVSFFCSLINKLTSYALTQSLLCIELKITNLMLSGHLKCIFEGFPVPAFIYVIFMWLCFIILMYAQSCVLKMRNILVCSSCVCLLGWCWMCLASWCIFWLL